jgi:hypothetical protein
VFAVLKLHLQISLSLLQLGYQIAVAVLVSVVLIIFASRSTLETLQLAFELEDKLLEFLDLEATLLNLDLDVNILFKSRIDLVWS